MNDDAKLPDLSEVLKSMENDSQKSINKSESLPTPNLENPLLDDFEDLDFILTEIDEQENRSLSVGEDEDDEPVIYDPPSSETAVAESFSDDSDDEDELVEEINWDDYDDEEPDTPSFDLEEDLEEEFDTTPPPIMTSDNEEIEKKDSDKGGLKKEKTSDIKEKFKKKFAEFKEQAKAELNGDEAPKKEPSKELAIIENDEDDEESDATDEKPKKKKSKSKKGKSPKDVLYAIKDFYLTIVEFFFKFIEKILSFFSKIPLIGIPFKFLLKFTKILHTIAMCIPLLLLIFVIIALNKHFVADSNELSLPDNGSAVFTEFSYSKENNTAEGIVTNTGDIIAEVTPTFKVYSTKPFNPITWVKPNEVSTCKGKPIKVDIEKSKKVTVKCSPNPAGVFPRVSGELK